MLRKVIVNPQTREPNFNVNTAGAILQQRLNWKDPIFQVAATTINYDITGIPGGAQIECAFIRNGANWTGGAIGTATLSMGSTGSPTAYASAVSVFAGSPKDVPATVLSRPTWVSGTATPNAAGTIRVQLVLTGANGNALLTGWADVFIWLRFFRLTA
jgi:hypothetical protein